TLCNYKDRPLWILLQVCRRKQQANADEAFLEQQVVGGKQPFIELAPQRSVTHFFRRRSGRGARYHVGGRARVYERDQWQASCRDARAARGAGPRRRRAANERNIAAPHVPLSLRIPPHATVLNGQSRADVLTEIEPLR